MDLKSKKAYLLIVAHPDDEVLGAGATIYKLSANSNNVSVAVMSMDARARKNRPDEGTLLADSSSAMDLLGVRNIIKGNFPNMEMNTVPHLHLVQFIEKAIMEIMPDIIITHHPSDTNNDHRQTSMACNAAIRLFQRRSDIKPMSEFWFMEVSSSTEWSVNTAENRFQPNTFIEIGKDGLNKKIEALSLYRGVMREYPHPRSIEALTGLAAYRGSQAGLQYAEAFECVFRRV